MSDKLPTEQAVSPLLDPRAPVYGSNAAAQLMPTDPAIIAILKSRARLLAAGQESTQVESTLEQYLRVRLGPIEGYGIPYSVLDEIMYVGNLAKVPCTPAHIAGVINQRGGLLTVLDLRAFFRTSTDTQKQEARIVVVKCQDIRAGLLVDAIEGNELFSPSELTPPLKSDGVTNMDYVQGIFGGDVTMLNIPAMLADTGIMVRRA